MRHIRDRYFKKRKNIQSKTAGRAKARLLAKYSGREKWRISDALHRASKVVASIVAEEGVRLVLENLKA